MLALLPRRGSVLVGKEAARPGGGTPDRALIAPLVAPSRAAAQAMLAAAAKHLDSAQVVARSDPDGAVLGDVPESVRLLLGVVGEGVKLTPGGRLPRAKVRSTDRRGTRSTARRASRRICSRWLFCMTWGAGSGCSGWRRVCCDRPRRRLTIGRCCVGFGLGSSPARSISSWPSGPPRCWLRAGR